MTPIIRTESHRLSRRPAWSQKGRTVMVDNSQPAHPRSSVVSDLLATLWGKVLAVLAAITMIVGIYVEVVAAWRGTNEAIITAANVEKAKAASCLERYSAIVNLMTGDQRDRNDYPPAFTKWQSDCADISPPHQMPARPAAPAKQGDGGLLTTPPPSVGPWKPPGW